MALRTVGVKLSAEVSGYVNQLRAAGASTKDFVGEMDRAAKAGKLDAVADQAGKMGLGLAVAFGGVIAVTAKFDKQMSEVGAVAGATSGELAKLRDAALDAGKATSFSASEAAQAEAELAKAGLSTSEILGGALSGSLALAAAGTLDLAEAADISAKTMNVFGLKGGDVGHIADVLAAAANKSATDVHEMGEALKMSGLAANAAGMSMEETVGTLAAFADRALSGSDAGTSLKTAIMMLQAPTEKSKTLMEKLGISAYDASGNFVGTAKLAGSLQTALGGLTQEQRNAALATIFGADGMRAANVLYTVGEQGIRDYVAAVDDQGAAAEVARQKMDNLSGDVEKLKGSLETLAIESGSGSTSALRTLVQGADNLVGSLAGIPASAQTAAVMVAGVGGAALLAASGAAKMRAATARAGEELSALGPHGQRAAQGLDRAGKAVGRVGVALAAMQVAAALGGDSLNGQADALGVGMEKFAKTGQVAGETARLFGDDMGKLDTALKDIGDTGRWSTASRGIGGFAEGISGLGNVMDDSLQHSKERLDALDTSLAQMVQSGHAEQAAAIFEKVAERAKEQGVSVEELKKVLPGYAGAIETAGAASGDAAGKVGEVGASAEQAAEEVDKLNTAFDDLFDVEMGLDEATLKYKQGIADLNKELLDGKRTLDINTQAGQDNTEAVLGQIDKIKALRDARFAHGMALDEANAKYTTDIDGLRRSMLQAGFTKKEVDALIGKYREVPVGVNTIVTANTGPATAAIEGFRKKINTIDGRVITVYARLTPQGNLYIPGQGTQLRRWGGVTEHAAGGLLREAHIASAVDGARYGYAERATGGEFFGPKFGDLAKTRAEATYAIENWWGGKVDWSGKSATRPPTYSTTPASGGTQTIVHEHHLVIDGTGVLKGFRKEMRLDGRKGVVG